MTKDTLDDKPGPAKPELPGTNPRPDRPTDLVWDGMIPGQPHEENTVHIARHRMIVPIGSLNLPVQQALALARAISPNVTGVHVTDDIEEARQIQRQWEERADGSGQLVIIESPYRSLVGPLLAYLDTVRAQNPSDTIMVVLPEFVPSRWWEHLLHNQTAFLLKAALLFRPGVVVADVPYHIRRSTSLVIGKPGGPDKNGEPSVHSSGRST